MDIPSSDAVKVLNYLLPGLVATWAFRHLTPHEKPKDFAAVIEALIFTAAIHPILLILEIVFLWIGRNAFQLGMWTENAEFVGSVVLGLILGIAFGVAANRDWIHSMLRTLGLTKQTSYPSEWYRHLFCEERFVILNLRNGDRIMGWPSEFPNSPDKGHFSLQNASWLPPEQPPQALETAECILIPAAEVIYLEFLKTEEEMTNE